MANITYCKGDATRPEHNGNSCLIVHVCNNQNGFGKGFAYAVAQKWPSVKQAYHRWYANGALENGCPFELGQIQVVPVTLGISVVNMISQRGYGRNNLNRHRTDEPDTSIPLQYDALNECLEKVAEVAKRLGMSVHMPRIGCGLAGGTWDKVGPIVDHRLDGISVTVYDI